MLSVKFGNLTTKTVHLPTNGKGPQKPLFSSAVQK